MHFFAIHAVVVGFTEQQLTLCEGSKEQVCVNIQNLAPTDIYPSINISLSITVENLTSVEGIIISSYLCESF